MIASAGMRTGAVLITVLSLCACAAVQGPPAVREIAPPSSGRAVAPNPSPTPPVQLSPGTHEAEIQLALGVPDFMRQEIDSQLWRYDGDNCSLFVFLYGEGGSQILRHAETTPPGSQGVPDMACVESIRSRALPIS